MIIRPLNIRYEIFCPIYNIRNNVKRCSVYCNSSADHIELSRVNLTDFEIFQSKVSQSIKSHQTDYNTMGDGISLATPESFHDFHE